MKEWWEIVPKNSDILYRYDVKRFLEKQEAVEYLSREHYFNPNNFYVAKVKIIEVETNKLNEEIAKLHINLREG